MTVLVVLPGLDGTATLHEDFLREVRVVFDEVTVLAYPTDRKLDYDELERLVRDRLPVDKSFSCWVNRSPVRWPSPSPRRRRPGWWAWCCPPRLPPAMPMLAPLAPLLRFAPVRAAPAALLSWWLFGKWATPAWTARLRAALARVSPAVLRHRAACSLGVDVSARLRDIQVRVLYLRATHDRLLGRKVGDRRVAALAHAELADIAGPHLLLQAAPRESAAAVRAFAGRYHAAQR